VRDLREELMTAIEQRSWPILLPSDFVVLDEKTLLVHQGAVLVKPELDKGRGRVLGYAPLCTDVLASTWFEKPKGALPADTVVSCFDCLAACER